MLGKVVAALLMVCTSVVALAGSAGASPGNLGDIDVAYLYNDLYVMMAHTKSGTVQVQPMICSDDAPDCQLHGWTTVGTGFEWVQISATGTNNMMLVGRRANGDTWYRRGWCSGVSCSWQRWYSLGGKVVSIRAEPEDYTNCVTIAGLSPKRRVYEARVCQDQRDYGWKNTGGSLAQIGVDRYGNIFGVTDKRTLWWHESGSGYRGTWAGGGGRITQPVQTNRTDTGDYCGLSSSKALWCFDKSSRSWQNFGGYFRKLDDGYVWGIGRDWSVWSLQDGGWLDGYGGKVNQVAWSWHLQAGVSSSGRPWYRNSGSGYYPWRAA